MLHVNEIFYSIKGEGEHTGLPTVFVRFQGCTQKCSFCDTKRAQTRQPGPRQGTFMSPRDIMESPVMMEAIDSAKMLVLTGGEPLEQPLDSLHELIILCREQRGDDFIIAFETAGGRYLEDFQYTITSLLENQWVTLSPKKNFPPYPGIINLASEFKWVISSPEDVLHAVRFRENCHAAVIRRMPHLLQPDSTVPEAVAICVEACKEHSFRLSVQVHKLIGVR